MYIEAVPNRGSPPAILLRESFRDNGRVKKRTLANLSDWPTALVEGFRTLLKGGIAVAAQGIGIRRALPHGHAAAVLGTIRLIGLDRLLGKPSDPRLAPLAIALIASRLISPTSKLATARDLSADTACSSLGRLLGLGAVDESSSTTPSTGSARARPRSRPGSPAAISKRGRWFSMTSLRLGSRDGAASWRALAIPVTARRASCRLSTVCCVRPMAVR
jgi:hypothetical protein